MRGISARPAGPVGSILTLVLGVLLLGAAVLMGAVLLALILGVAALAGALVAVRLWWARRRGGPRSTQTEGQQGRDGVIIEGEYRRRETGTSRREPR